MHLDMYLSTEFPKVIFSTFHRFLSYHIRCKYYFLYNLFLLGFLVLKCEIFLFLLGKYHYLTMRRFYILSASSLSTNLL